VASSAAAAAAAGVRRIWTGVVRGPARDPKSSRRKRAGRPMLRTKPSSGGSGAEERAEAATALPLVLWWLPLLASPSLSLSPAMASMALATP
jgi:hypothetical protein